MRPPDRRPDRRAAISPARGARPRPRVVDGRGKPCDSTRWRTCTPPPPRTLPARCSHAAPSRASPSRAALCGGVPRGQIGVEGRRDLVVVMVAPDERAERRVAAEAAARASADRREDVAPRAAAEGRLQLARGILLEEEGAARREQRPRAEARATPLRRQVELHRRRRRTRTAVAVAEGSAAAIALAAARPLGGARIGPKAARRLWWSRRTLALHRRRPTQALRPLRPLRGRRASTFCSH